MARIPLRSYLQEIERLVDSQHIDEAIAHSRHILQNYPKYLDIYRVLGKAYLEAKRYGDAADIFQRVLSSSPEDFVSNAGMSIIREDEGNLDEAIWFMERAFEIEPSNSTIQDELRRLIGKRDGIEPPRIRLTRGALARMYMKGDLTQEAITELRIALTEDSNRIDLKALLAIGLYRLGQRVEAIEAANQVLRKLPNNLESNRILAELLAGTERDAEAQTHRKVVSELDPYFNFVTPSTPLASQVPNQAINIEKLEYKAASAVAALPVQPEWAVPAAEISAEPEPPVEPAPEWLSVRQEVVDQRELPSEDLESSILAEAIIEDDKEITEKTSLPGAEEPVHQPQEDFPEWMQQAGWVPLTNQVEPQTPPEVHEVFEPEDFEKPPGELQIPEWLSEGEADKEPVTETGSPEVKSEEELPEWVFDKEPAFSSENQLPPWLSESPAEEESQEEIPSNKSAVEEEGLPDWLFVEEIASEIDPSKKTEIPDWLMEEVPSETSNVSDVPIEPPKDGIPSWLFEEESSSGEADLSAGKQAPEVSTPMGTSEAETQEISSVLVDHVDETEISKGELPFDEFPEGGDEIPETPQPAVDQSLNTLKLPAWLLESHAEFEPSAPSQPEPSPETKPVDSASREAGQDEKHPVEESAGFPAWLLDEDVEAAETTSIEPIEKVKEIPDSEPLPEWFEKLEEAPIEEEDTKPSKITRADAISTAAEELPEAAVSELSVEEIASPPELPGAEMLVQEENEALIQQSPQSMVGESEEVGETVEFAQEKPAEEEQPYPEWLLEEELFPTGEVPRSPESGTQLVESEKQPVEQESQAAGSEAEHTATTFESEILELPDMESERTLRAEIMSQEILDEAEGSDESIEMTEELVQDSQAEEVLGEIPDWLVAPEVEKDAVLDWTPPPIQPAEYINLNTGTLVEIEKIPGIGFIRAQNIINYRENNGPFSDIEELSKVPGMTADVVETIKDYVYIEQALPDQSENESVEVSVYIEGIPEELQQSRIALEQENLDLAIGNYMKYIEANQYLPEIIQDLTSAAEKHPENPDIWLSLGDAYIRSNQVQNALSAYRQAEKLLL